MISSLPKVPLLPDALLTGRTSFRSSRSMRRIGQISEVTRLWCDPVIPDADSAAPLIPDADSAVPLIPDTDSAAPEEMPDTASVTPGFPDAGSTMPRSAATSLPVFSAPGYSSSPGLIHCMVTVTAAYMPVPSTLPVSASTPLGISIDTIRARAALAFWIRSRMLPTTSLVRPMPSSASTMTSNEFQNRSPALPSSGISSGFTARRPSRPQIPDWRLVSAVMFSSLPANSTVTGTPFICRMRAQANPSPPLFPDPHRISTAPSLSPRSDSTSSAAARAALSMSTADGTPIFSIV